MRAKVVAVLWVALVYVGCSSALGSLLVNGGFEVLEPVEPVLPTSAGDWSGDGGTIVAAENGVTPVEGAGMLRFDRTYLGQSNYTATTSDQWQLVDLTHLVADVASGNVEINLGAQVNRVAGGALTDTEFRVTLRAYSGAISDFPSDAKFYLAESAESVVTDADVATWEPIEASLLLPETATYVGVVLTAVENVHDGSGYPEFDGHYADDAILSLFIVPEPSVIGLLGMSALVVGFVHRSRRSRR